MTKKKSTKRALISSLLILAMCFTMLVGTTFAWFTDSVTSGRNKIVAGSLDMTIEVYTGATNGTAFADSWATVTNTTKIFAEDATTHQTSFEPGAVQVAYVRVKNSGDLAFKYRLTPAIDAEIPGTNQENQKFYLSNFLYFGTANPAAPYGNRSNAINDVSTGAEKLKDVAVAGSGELLVGGATSDVIALVIYMPETTGNEANPKPGAQYKPSISFGLNAVATQYTEESDSFGKTYDANAELPAIAPESSAKAYDVNGTTIETPHAKVTVPAGAKADGTALTAADTLNLNVESGTPDANLQITDGNGTTTYEVTLTNQDGDKVTSDTGIKVELNIGVVDLQHFYHNATQLNAVNSLADVDALNEYYYDVTTGILTFITDSFSPFTAEFKFAGGLGTEAYPYKISSIDDWNAMYPAATAGVANKVYYALTKDIDFTGKTVDNAANSNEDITNFVLDGQGYAVKGISTFTGYKQLFPYIYESTIKNLTINYNVDTNKTVATSYNANNVVFENVTVTGLLKTKADWSSAFVAYPYGSGSVVYRNCVNRAKLVANKSTDAYVAPFGSHTMSIGSMTLENCSNYGEIIGGYASAFIGMTGDNSTRYTVSGLTNYGSVKYANGGGLFTYGNHALNAQVTAGEGSSVNKMSSLNVAIEEGKLVINDAEDGEDYKVTMSVSVQMYNYNNSGSWSGGFPRSLIKNYSGSDAVDGKIVTDFVQAPVMECPATRTGYGKNGAAVAYTGIFVADSIVNNATVKLSDSNNVIKLLSSGGHDFYYVYDSDYPEWYSLVTTLNGAESGVLKGSITVTFNVETDAASGKVTYTFSIPEAAAIFA